MHFNVATSSSFPATYSWLSEVTAAVFPPLNGDSAGEADEREGATLVDALLLEVGERKKAVMFL